MVILEKCMTNTWNVEELGKKVQKLKLKKGEMSSNFLSVLYRLEV